MRTAGAIGVCLFAGLLASAAHSSGTPSSPAPRFTLPARTGTACLDSLRGHVVLVDFWASWCEPCKRSFPWMGSIQQRYASRGLRVMAINLDKDPALADAFLDKYPAPFTVAFDASGKTAEAYRVKAMPTSFLVGRDGNILYSHAGFDPRQTGPMETRIAEACAP